MDSSPPLTAVIIDISKSRSHADRAALQHEIETAFARVNSEIPALQPIAPTVSDEFQAVYADLALTLRATLLARLVLPEGTECRFGIGRGDVVVVGSGVVGAVQDGSAWWTARKAIDEARQHQYSKLGFVRTWYNSESVEDALVNAYLLARDQIVGAMNPRARRLLLGQLLGSTQAQLALDEGISQSAVSQNLSRSGANAIVAGAALIAKDPR